MIKSSKSKVPMATVYIVDDDAGVRKALGFLAETLRVPVKTFATGEELLDAEPGSSGGCVVLDVNLPGLNGVSLCKLLAEHMENLPVILFTGQPSDGLRKRAARAGAFAFLEKPIDESILNIIRQALAKSAKGMVA